MSGAVALVLRLLSMQSPLFPLLHKLAILPTWRISRSLSLTGTRNKNSLRDELLLDREFVLSKDGDLAVSLDKPGLGVTVNMEALQRFLV